MNDRVTEATSSISLYLSEHVNGPLMTCQEHFFLYTVQKIFVSFFMKNYGSRPKKKKTPSSKKVVLLKEILLTDV